MYCFTCHIPENEKFPLDSSSARSEILLQFLLLPYMKHINNFGVNLFYPLIVSANSV